MMLLRPEEIGSSMFMERWTWILSISLDIYFQVTAY